MKKLSPEEKARLGLDTRLGLAGRNPGEQFGFVNAPIYRGSTVLSSSAAEYRTGGGRFSYGRQQSPTIAALEEAWTDLAGAAGTVLTNSGLSAVTLALLSCLKAGDHVLVTDSAYFPTRRFCQRTLARFGVETTYYDPRIGAGIEALFRPGTRAVYTESPGSLTFEIQDIPAIAEVAHRRGALVLMDNTWATPLLFRAHDHGVDLAIEAGTKYLSGSSDLMLGLVSASATAWPDLKRAYTDLGVGPGPEDVFLALRGLRTMALRLKQHQESAFRVAQWLAEQPQVRAVLHPALPGSADRALWTRDFRGASGLFSVVLQPCEPASVDAFVDGLALFGIGASWGGYESLIVPFDGTDIRTATAWRPGGPTLRIHIGLEDPSDLIADLAAGLGRLKPAAG